MSIFPTHHKLNCVNHCYDTMCCAENHGRTDVESKRDSTQTISEKYLIVPISQIHCKSRLLCQAALLRGSPEREGRMGNVH